MSCKFFTFSNTPCPKSAILNRNFCKNHMFYENKLDPNNLKRCHKNHLDYMIYDDNNNYYCRVCKINEEKNKIKENKIYCKGINNKGTPCKYEPLENDLYCKLHQSYKKWKSFTDSNKRICNNWIRGCWNELNDDFTRCLECRQKERITEKKLRTVKKECAQDFNSKNQIEKMCKDCTNIVNQLINECCIDCYKKKYNNNKNRNLRNPYLERLTNCKNGAKKRNLEWNLDDENAIILLKQKCYYCNNINEVNGLDRIDSSKGYSKENCVSCCFHCNSMKGNKNINIFYKICEHIATYNELYTGKLYPELFETAKTSNFNQYNYTAIKRGIQFNLNKEDFNNLFLKKWCNRSVSYLFSITNISR